MKDPAIMKIYGEKELLYIQKDASGVGVGVGLLQVRDRKQLPQDKAPDNIVLHLMTFAS